MARGGGIYWHIFKLYRLVKHGLIKPEGFKFLVRQPRNGLLLRSGVIRLEFLGDRYSSFRGTDAFCGKRTNAAGFT